MELLLEALTYAGTMPPPLSSASPTPLTLFNSHSYGAAVASPSTNQQAATSPSTPSTPSPLSPSPSLVRHSSTPLSAALLTPDLDLNIDPFSLGSPRVVSLDSPPRRYSHDQDSMGVPQKPSFSSFRCSTPDGPGTSSQTGSFVEINEHSQVRPFLRQSSTAQFEILPTPVSRPALSERERQVASDILPAISLMAQTRSAQYYTQTVVAAQSVPDHRQSSHRHTRHGTSQSGSRRRYSQCSPAQFVSR